MIYCPNILFLYNNSNFDFMEEPVKIHDKLWRFTNNVKYEMDLPFDKYCNFDNKITIDIDVALNDVKKLNDEINNENCAIWFINEKFSIAYNESWYSKYMFERWKDIIYSPSEYIIKNLLE